jgi:hypothetical protein
MIHYYGSLVPRQFRTTTPVSTHEFQIIEPCHVLFELTETWSGRLKTIEPSAFCRIREGGVFVPLLIPNARFPVLASAVMNIARLPQAGGQRVAKYLALFQIYESLQSGHDPDLSALRHALAHSPAVLNRPTTVRRLQNLFGTVNIDLENIRHRRIFWRLFGQLLIEVDTLLAVQLRSVIQDVRMPEDCKRQVRR